MILGIGTDLLHLARLRALLARRHPHQLATRILSPTELLEWDECRNDGSNSDPEGYLALRWTAKEAAYKALYPQYKLTWKDLDVSKQDKKPHLEFSTTFLSHDKRRADLSKIKLHLSVSHDGDFMTAFVVAEKA
ncbi:hypothetical protein JCM16303_005760 [Sporobolomyces ruberrimus]